MALAAKAGVTQKLGATLRLIFINKLLYLQKEIGGGDMKRREDKDQERERQKEGTTGKLQG